MLAPWRKNFKSRRYAHVKMMWGEASNRAALTGDLGAGPESMSTSEGRLFYVSAGKSAFNILGLFQQYRSLADITPLICDVRFTPGSGHQLDIGKCLPSAKSGLLQCSKEHHYSITSSAVVSSVCRWLGAPAGDREIPRPARQRFDRPRPRPLWLQSVGGRCDGSDGTLRPLQTTQLLLGLVAHPWTGLDLYGYAGEEQVNANFWNVAGTAGG